MQGDEQTISMRWLAAGCGLLICSGSAGLALLLGIWSHFQETLGRYGGNLPGPTQFVIDVRLPFVCLGATGTLVVAALGTWRSRPKVSLSLLLGAAALSCIGGVAASVGLLLPLLVPSLGTTFMP